MDKGRKTWTERRQLATKVIDFYKNKAGRNSTTTWNFFKQENFPKTNVYSYIKKFKDSKNVEFKKPSGGPVKLGTNKVGKIAKTNLMASFGKRIAQL